MNQEQWNFLDRYFGDQIVHSDAALKAALEASIKAGLPSINVAENQGKFLHLLAKIRGARRILEIGTLGGYSSIWLARALPAGGALVTLEADADYAAVARANIEWAGLSDAVSVILGMAADSLQQMIADGVEPFDLVFIDADKPSYPDYLRLCLKLSRTGTVIVADNVIRHGKLADPANTDPDVQGMRQFFDLLAKHAEVESTAIQTVGAKGWDGFSISLVSR
ncbi:O-methyltransferase [Dyella caseinilytica]|uniref:O-methyltransferase n=1 Tax=Dyella caseinilytica TaxID=1849581 RepID=A0ABX7GRT8_9GAMM|nr:O-methyltransferase [Dyella caseinilytica]QRN53091.1 O-methyltransferase [Dyella caseinilytica]GGA11379.1 O-methyltransferase [Dyella caseinilytica]